jgi:long-chain acyl-CoA synthetase
VQIVNVGSLLSNAAHTYGDGTALRFGERRFTYAELNDRAGRFASALRRRGLEPGDRVAIFMANNPEYVVCLFGVFKAGLIAVPVNAKLSSGELDYILDNSGATGLVFDADRASTLAEGAGLGGVDLTVQVGDPEGEAIGFDVLVAEGGSGFLDEAVDPTDPAWLFYTSGTTGRPKGARLSHRNLIAMTMNQLADLVSISSDDIVLHAAPLSHGSGLYILGSIARGAVNLIYDRPSFDPGEFVRTIEQESVSIVAFMAPTMIVLALDAAEGADTSSLRCIIYGGAPIHLDHAQRMLQRFGQVFVQLYGQGECPMTITYLSAAAHDPNDPDRLTSAGIRRTDVEVEVKAEDGTILPVGAEGEICVRGDVVMDGYWENAAATAQALRDGWLHTGDIGRFDEQGVLYLLDRTSDMIITGGSNVYPREVEDVLIQHQAVSESAVFGVEDELWGEAVAAAIVLAPGQEVSPEGLIDFSKQRLASFKKPKYVFLVDELPKNAYGKVLRRELRATLRT